MTTQDNQHMLDLLTQEGVLLNVSVRYYRAAKKLQALDIGLDPDDVTDRLISLGHKRLLPKEVLAPLALIESRVHGLVDTNTFPFLGGLARFLPNKRLAEVSSRLHELEAEFITTFRSLNFANDAELERQLEHVRTTYLTTTAEQYRDDATARQRMQNGIERLGEAARELAATSAMDVVDSFGRMGTRRFTMAA